MKFQKKIPWQKKNIIKPTSYFDEKYTPGDRHSMPKFTTNKKKRYVMPIKILLTLKFSPKNQDTKVTSIEIGNEKSNLLSLKRVNRKYQLIKNDNEIGFINTKNRREILSRIKQRSDYFADETGYADYKISLSKDASDLWKSYYDSYSEIFNISDTQLAPEIHFRKAMLSRIFYALSKYNMQSWKGYLKTDWKTYSLLVTTIALTALDKVLDKNDMKFVFEKPDKISLPKIDKEIGEEIDNLAFKVIHNKEAISYEESIFKLLNLNLDQDKIERILTLANLLKDSSECNYYLLSYWVDNQQGYNKFVRNYIETINKNYKFRFFSSVYAQGQFALTSNGIKTYTEYDVMHNFCKYVIDGLDILLPANDKNPDLIGMFRVDRKYIPKGVASRGRRFYDDPDNLRTEYMTKESVLRRIKVNPKWAVQMELSERISKYAPRLDGMQYLFSNCITELRKNVRGFIVCHPNKTDVPYNVPMESDFDFVELDAASERFRKKYSELLEKEKKIAQLAKLKERAGFYTQQQTREMYRLQRAYRPDQIWPDGHNFDRVIINNSQLRKQLNKILREIFNLEIKIFTPKYLKKLTKEKRHIIEEGFRMGSFRQYWGLRRFLDKDKFIVLRDLNFDQYFVIHGREIGKGPSNILPFLTQILSDRPNMTYLIQELENNWHPKYQAKIIELIAKIANDSKNKHFILETHSELFILQVKKLVQKGVLKPEDVSINYISRSSKGDSKVNHIPLNSEGTFMKEWPGGFFNERVEILTS